MHYEADAPIVVVPVDRPTAEARAEAFRRFDAGPGLAAAGLTGAGGVFCCSADLK